MLSDTEQRAVQAIDRLQDDLVSLLQRMVREQTVNPPGEYEGLVSMLGEWLDAAGMDIETVPVPDEVCLRAGVNTGRTNLLARLPRDGPGPSVWFNAHLDTVASACVPADDGLWSVPPFEGLIRDGRVWGRGACDSKGRMAGYAGCLAGLASTGALRNGQAVLAATADEETCASAETGIGYLVDQDLVNADFAVVEGMITEISYANMGELVLDLSFTGAQLHTSQLQEQSRTASDSMVSLLAEILTDFAADTGPASDVDGIDRTVLTIEQLRASGDCGMSDPECRATVNVALSPDHDDKEIVRRINGKLRQASGGGIEGRLTVRAAVPGAIGDARSATAAALNSAARDLGVGELPVKGLPGRTDLGHFLRAGADAVNFGAGRLFESNLHLPDENVRIEDLIKSAQVCAVATLRLLDSEATRD